MTSTDELLPLGFLRGHEHAAQGRWPSFCKHNGHTKLYKEILGSSSLQKRLHNLVFCLFVFFNQNIIFAPAHSSDIENDDARLQAIIYDV